MREVAGRLALVIKRELPRRIDARRERVGGIVDRQAVWAKWLGGEREARAGRAWRARHQVGQPAELDEVPDVLRRAVLPVVKAADRIPEDLTDADVSHPIKIALLRVVRAGNVPSNRRVRVAMTKDGV